MIVYIVPYLVVVVVGTIEEIGKIETAVVVDKIGKDVAVMHYTYLGPVKMSSSR